MANLPRGRSVAGASSKKRAAVETGWGKAVEKEVSSKRRKTEEAALSAEELKGYQLYISSHWYGIHHKQDQIVLRKTHPPTYLHFIMVDPFLTINFV